MNIPIEEPVVTEVEKGPMPGQTITHPAFACIRASRVSGQANLYESDFQHQHYVTVSISRSELHRSLANNWHHGREELIEVALSESQWAHFVSSMNMGSGAPCTLQRLAGAPNQGMVPRLPPPKPMTDQFAKEIKEVLAENCAKLQAIATQVAEGGAVTKKQALDLAKAIASVSSSLKGTTTYIADQFDEHVERTVDKAKTEINAYAMNTVVKAGLQALGVPILVNENMQISLDKPDTVS